MADAPKTNKYGNIVYATTLPNNIPIQLSLFESPFKDSYLAVSSGDTLIMAVSMETKKDGAVIMKNVGQNFIRIATKSTPKDL